MTTYTRRRLLAVGGAVTAGALAGCSGGGPTENAVPDPDGVILEALSLQNLHDQSHTLDVIIQRDDEIEYWTTHQLGALGDGDSSLTLDTEWSTEPGVFQLIVRLDDDLRTQVSSTQVSTRDCLDLVVTVTREGELSILTDVSDSGCSTDSDGDTADTGDE